MGKVQISAEKDHHARIKEIEALFTPMAKSLDDLEKNLELFATSRPMTLVLPSLFSELEKPALQLIVDELKKVKYLNSIVIGLDQAK